MHNIWTVSWSRSKNGVDIETTADIESDSATDSVRSFMLLFPEQHSWEKQVIRTEKNHTYFLFIIEKTKLRRI